MTSIKFFIGFSSHATTIADLFSRLHYLNTARRHFQISLEDKQHTMERKTGRSKGHRQFGDPQRGMGSPAKTMSVSELQSHISTITLQIKVTTSSSWFTHLVSSSYPPTSSSHTLITHPLSSPPSLFHPSHVSPLTTHTGDTVPLPLCRGYRYDTRNSPNGFRGWG